jgi:hypothetical protein
MMFAFLAVLLVLFLAIAAAIGALAEAITMLAGVGVAVILITIFGG